MTPKLICIYCGTEQRDKFKKSAYGFEICNECLATPEFDLPGRAAIGLVGQEPQITTPHSLRDENNS